MSPFKQKIHVMCLGGAQTKRQREYHCHKQVKSVRERSIGLSHHRVNSHKCNQSVLAYFVSGHFEVFINICLNRISSVVCGLLYIYKYLHNTPIQLLTLNTSGYKHKQWPPVTFMNFLGPSFGPSICSEPQQHKKMCPLKQKKNICNYQMCIKHKIK